MSNDPTYAELEERLYRRRTSCPPSFGREARPGVWVEVFEIGDDCDYAGLVVCAEWDDERALWLPRFVAYPGEELREVKR